jgi:hypothetical protein
MLQLRPMQVLAKELGGKGGLKHTKVCKTSRMTERTV